MAQNTPDENLYSKPQKPVAFWPKNYEKIQLSHKWELANSLTLQDSPQLDTLQTPASLATSNQKGHIPRYRQQKQSHGTQQAKRWQHQPPAWSFIAVH